MMAAMALILFPKLALGLSGFETGVAVMPLVRGDATDTEDNPAGRIRNTKKLLSAAALIMSVFLLASSFVSVLSDSRRGLSARRAGRRPGARLSRPHVPRVRLRHVVRPGDGRHSVVRRRVGAGRAAEPRAALPAALRHGARMGARHPAARRDLHRHRHPRDDRSSAPTSMLRPARTRPASSC